MSYLHICNTFFEKELETGITQSLKKWMSSHPVVLQLQFLPLLYAAPNDLILVSDLPENPDPRLRLIDHLPKEAIIEHWGPSLAIANWAKEHGITYSIPEWEIIRKINSKIFSFTESPKLPGAKILYSQKELEEWIHTIEGPKILKTPFGTAGRGHLQPNAKKLYNLPLIGEPWVERIMDFSTQWENQKLIGITIFENEPNGTYKRTYLGDIEKWALDEHLDAARPLVEKIGLMGYKGILGIDAFIYLWGKEKRVHPIVEINARKTMSWVCLQLPEKKLSYIHSKVGLLPTQIGETTFLRNIICT